MPPAPTSQTGLASLRERIRRDLEREQRRLEWIERGPPTRKVLAKRTRGLIAAYQQLERELSMLPEQDEATLAAWLEHMGRVGAVMKARRTWPWWVYARMGELAQARKDKRGAG
jgi:hypothetical protein